MSSWLSRALGTNSMKQDFNYTPADANIPNMNFGQIANQMLSGEGEFFDRQRQAGRSAISDQAYNAANRQSMALAQRGMGSGGLRGLLDATSAAQAGEQASQFNLGLAQQGFQQAGQFAGLGLQQALANQQAQNEAKQFALVSSYNQATANRQARANFFGNVVGLASNFIDPTKLGKK